MYTPLTNFFVLFEIMLMCDFRFTQVDKVTRFTEFIISRSRFGTQR